MYIIYVNNTLPLALAVHEISRHFWAPYAPTKSCWTMPGTFFDRLFKKDKSSRNQTGKRRGM